MLKRPLNPRFTRAVIERTKTTTIRKTPWPVGIPIMLYNWSGAAYRSTHADVATIVVDEVCPIKITHCANGRMRYSSGRPGARALHESEGFDSQAQMDEWFRAVVKPGKTVVRRIMSFRLASGITQP